MNSLKLATLAFQPSAQSRVDFGQLVLRRNLEFDFVAWVPHDDLLRTGGGQWEFRQVPLRTMSHGRRIVENAEWGKKPLPTLALESFLADTSHDPQVRRLAFDLLVQHDKMAGDRFLPKMVNDPSPELRRDAIGRVLDEAEKLFNAEKKAEARSLFQKAFAAARDKDQIDKIAKRLKDLGPSRVKFPQNSRKCTSNRLATGANTDFVSYDAINSHIVVHTSSLPATPVY